VAVAVVVVVAVLASGGPLQTSIGSPAPRAGPITIFEAEQQMHQDPAATLKLMQRLGVDYVKEYLPWNDIAPDPFSLRHPRFDAADPAAYPAGGWAAYDTIARDAAARGVGLILTVGGPVPLWATGPDPPRGKPDPEWKPSGRAFGNFVRAVATRYSGHYTPPGASSPLPRVSFWSIWNEPNYGIYLAPQAIQQGTLEVAPSLYRRLLDAAWAALQATGHGHDTILIGETAPRGITAGTGPGIFTGMVPLRFIRALYCVDGSLRPLRGLAAQLRGCPATAAGTKAFPQQHPALFQAGGFADHPYPQGSVPPDVVTPFEPDYADLAAVPKLEQTLDTILRAYGSSRRFQIYDTEFGYQTNPPETIARALPPPKAAVYLNWSEYITWRDRRIASWDQYLLTDPPGGNFATGLEFADGRPKALFSAFRMPIFLPVSSASRGTALEVWGCVRPAGYAKRRSGTAQAAEIEFEPAGAAAFEVLRRVSLLDPYGYFDVRVTFPASGTVRITWSYPGGRTIHSRSVAVTMR
jgi:hypothetical protein